MDRVNLFLPGYRQQLQISHRYTATGRIADLGSGSGLTCAYLSFLEPARQMYLIDSNATALALAESRMAWARAQVECKTSSVIGVPIQNGILEMEMEENAFDTILMNNSIPYFTPDQRKVLLRKIKPALKKNGRLIIQDPPWRENVDLSMKYWTDVQFILENHGPLTEFDWALYAANFAGIFGAVIKSNQDEPTNPYLPNLRALGEELGYRVEEAFLGRDNQGLILQAP